MAAEAARASAWTFAATSRRKAPIRWSGKVPCSRRSITRERLAHRVASRPSAVRLDGTQAFARRSSCRASRAASHSHSPTSRAGTRRRRTPSTRRERSSTRSPSKGPACSRSRSRDRASSPSKSSRRRTRPSSSRSVGSAPTGRRDVRPSFGSRRDGKVRISRPGRSVARRAASRACNSPPTRSMKSRSVLARRD